MDREEYNQKVKGFLTREFNKAFDEILDDYYSSSVVDNFDNKCIIEVLR